MANTPEMLVGSSSAMRAVREDMRLASDSDATVLITGERGVGKEIIARIIHDRSHRRSSAFVSINCAGVAESLLESKLFGHARGSFTGACGDPAGLLEHADGGTIFMDEAGEMSLRMQSMLLRFLETRVIQCVAALAPQVRVVDARIIAATNRNLLDRIRSREFREDLYYRLNVIHIFVPPLRERREDIEPLFRYFLQRCAMVYGADLPAIQANVLQRLIEYEWPGNVRELRNVAERLTEQGNGGTITREDLSRVVLAPPESGDAAAASSPADIAAMLLQRIVEQGQPFWDVVYDPFISGDITRTNLRRLVALGLQQTHANYRILVRHFNMPQSDYRRFLNFLHKHACYVPASTV
jgi:transcriptional regulator with PAS, ATPase and Fis domain